MNFDDIEARTIARALARIHGPDCLSHAKRLASSRRGAARRVLEASVAILNQSVGELVARAKLAARPHAGAHLPPMSQQQAGPALRP